MDLTLEENNKRKKILEPQKGRKMNTGNKIVGKHQRFLLLFESTKLY